MARTYRNPPIIEALCEIQFTPNSPWDLTVPGLLYEKLRGTFPERQQSKVVSVGVGPGPDPASLHQQVWAADRMQFVRSDGTALVQVGPHFLSVNHLKPYPTWKHFRPLIEMAFIAYRDVAVPTGIQRIGLRYINRFEFLVGSIKLEDYFDFYPHVGQGFPQDYGTFLVGIQIAHADGRDVLQVQAASVNPEAYESKAMILDLDYSLQMPSHVVLDDVPEWIEEAHRRIEEAFEAAITDRLRESLEEVTG